MKGQRDKIYKKKIPFTALTVYSELQKYPVGTEFTFDQICKLFPNEDTKVIYDYLESLVENDHLDYYIDVQTYTLHVGRQFKVFVGE